MSYTGRTYLYAHLDGSVAYIYLWIYLSFLRQDVDMQRRLSLELMMSWLQLKSPKCMYMYVSSHIYIHVYLCACMCVCVYGEMYHNLAARLID